MNNTIIDLWYGNIAPYEQCGAHNPKILKQHSLIERNQEGLLAGLNDAQKELFQKYADCYDEYLISMMELAFCDGYALGCQLTTEALK